MVSVHLKKLRKHVTLNAQEEQIVRSLVSEVRKFAPDQVAVRAGEPLNSTDPLLSTLAARHLNPGLAIAKQDAGPIGLSRFYYDMVLWS